MKSSLIVTVAMLWVSQTHGTALPSQTLADVRPVQVPAFDAERGLQWSSSRDDYDAARADERFGFEQFTYESDGLTVGDRIRTPVLIMHGTADEDIPLEHSQRIDAELTRLGKTHRFLTFEGQQHRIGGRGAERDAAAIEWFRRFD